MDGQVPKLNYICMLTTWLPTVTIICNNLIKTGSGFNAVIIPAFFEYLSALNYILSTRLIEFSARNKDKSNTTLM